MEKEVKRIIEEKLGIDHYKEEDNFREDLGCDSLDMIEVIMECEREFNIVIPDSAFDSIKTIQDLIDYIKEHTK